MFSMTAIIYCIYHNNINCFRWDLGVQYKKSALQFPADGDTRGGIKGPTQHLEEGTV